MHVEGFVAKYVKLEAVVRSKEQKLTDAEDAFDDAKQQHHRAVSRHQMAENDVRKAQKRHGPAYKHSEACRMREDHPFATMTSPLPWR